MAEEVQLLRGFRDDILAPKAIGRAMLAIYEHCSPPLARWIAGRPWARKVIRNLLIHPLALVLDRTRH
jgi:hypothetical protein